MIRHSLSKLKTYEQCPLKYKLRYLDGLSDAPGPAAQRGTAIHASIDAHIANPKIPLPQDLSRYASFLNSVRDSGGKSEVTLTLDKDWKPVSEEVWYKGILDALVLKPPEAWLYDWKTGKEYDDHYEQKEIYSLAVFCSYSEIQTVRAIHVYLDHGRNTERVYDRAQAEPMRQRWDARFKRLEAASEFHPNPNFGCRYCSFSKSKGGPCRF